ncbi:DNA (cytosine-5)-methyltransferase 3B-like [Durio zibethinus]|uniref:DNA (Cytosine-5)-methyltransferase 3B-like n=1 Tax=Durio zibethinus TaxID=66656 RepID=A0A6P6ANH6_DURZI|nr:DNA (cytosine-5)-methyltransferase 3B-like [Durio zibethinus]
MCESQKGQATEGKSTAGSKIHDKNNGEGESAALQLEGEVSRGDLIWVKLHGNSWWPALVIDENSVSESSKPGNRSQGEVLVRLYGSHEYLYADPMKYYSEFKIILEQNNGSCYDILDKALEQDCSHRKSIKPKGQGSKSAANRRADASKDKKKLKPNSLHAEENARIKNPRRNGSNVLDKARSGTSEQDEIQKKLKRKSPSTDKQAKNKANEPERVQKKQKKNNQIVEKMEPNSRSAKEAIKQIAVQKKTPKSSTSKEQKRGKTSKQGEEQKKVKPDSPSSHGKKSRTSKQHKLSKEQTNSQSSEISSPENSPKSSARRMRVMQGLGLTAPPGSPFQKN